MYQMYAAVPPKMSVVRSACLLALLSGLAWGCGADRPLPTPPVIEAPEDPAPPAPKARKAASIAAYGLRTCVVGTDGTVWCWGIAERGASGTPRQVPGIDDAVEVSVAGGHDCARRSNGTVSCWGAGRAVGRKPGESREGLYSVPGVTDAEALASGREFTCALGASGHVSCWGQSSESWRPAVRELELEGRADEIAAGSRSVCALARGDIWCFAVEEETPAQRLGTHKYRDLAMTTLGGVCGVGEKGGLSCFGSPCTGKHSKWEEVCDGGITKGATAIVAGRHLCAKVEKEWQCWGDNTSHQIGPGGQLVSEAVPLGHKKTLGPVVDLALGERHTCALSDTGDVTCWGSDRFGALGRGPSAWVNRRYVLDGPAKSAGDLALNDLVICRRDAVGARCRGEPTNAGSRLKETSVIIGEAKGAVAIAGRVDHMCARRPNDLVCWGMNYRAPTTVPVEAAEDLAVGGRFGCAVAGPTRALWCWGDDADFDMPGELGLGRGQHVPAAISGVTGVAAIAAGTDHICWQTTGSDAVSCLGKYLDARRSTMRSAQPAESVVLPGVTALAAGTLFTCAIAGGEVKCWGDGRGGALGNGRWEVATEPVVAGVTGARSLAASRHHVCAVTGEGSVHCWGRNLAGELGSGDRLSRNVPTRVLGLDDAIGVVVGQSHSCAVRRNGEVVCWGAGARTLFDPNPDAASFGPARIRPLAPAARAPAVTRVPQLRGVPASF